MYFLFVSPTFCSTKAAADSGIRRDFLQPAAECATTPAMKIKAYTVLGHFSHRCVCMCLPRLIREWIMTFDVRQYLILLLSVYFISSHLISSLLLFSSLLFSSLLFSSLLFSSLLFSSIF